MPNRMTVFARLSICTLVFSLASAWLPAAFAASGDKEGAKTAECVVRLRADGQRTKYRFGKVGTIESLDFGGPGGDWDDYLHGEARGLMLRIFAEYIVKKSMMPSAEDITEYVVRKITKGKATKGEYQERYGVDAADEIPEKIWQMIADPEAVLKDLKVFTDRQAVIKMIADEYPPMYAELRLKVQQQALLFFRHRLRPPTLRELAATLKFEDIRLLGALISTPGFWTEAIYSDVGRHVDYARKRIKTAYARAVRGTDTNATDRTRRVQPSVRRLVQVMIQTKSNEHYRWRANQGDYGKYDVFDKRHKARADQVEAMLAELTTELEAMLGMREMTNDAKDPADRWVFNMPKLFPQGLAQLHVGARGEYQPTFTSFEDKQNFPVEYAEMVRQKIVDAKGLIVSTILPNAKVDWEMVEGMLKMSKDRGYPIILIPADGPFNLHKIDKGILNHPDIYLLTSSIGNDEFLLSNLPSNMRTKALAPFQKPGMYKIGQQIILPHHTLAHESVPTAHNAINQTQLFSTGCVNLPLIAAVGKFQKNKAERMAKEVKRSFLIAEKIDRGAEAETYGGATNHWHIRPVEFRPAEGDVPAVMVDGNAAYVSGRDDRGKIHVLKEKVSAVQLYFPDVHFVTANARVLAAIQDYMDRMIKKGVEVTLVFPDPIDSLAINHHVEYKQGDWVALRKLMASGQLNFEDEINEAVTNVNHLLNRFPGVNIVFQYSNHSDEWIDKNLLKGPSWLQLIANGPLINDMRAACSRNGWTPLEFLLLHRERWLKATSLDGSDAYKDHTVFLSDTSRVRTMRIGEPLATGSDDWRVFSQHHGHKGSNGGRSSFNTHAMGETRSITGDAHRMGFYGRGNQLWVGVGSTSFEQPYTQGGYSSWGVGMAVISPYNTVQLVQWDPYTQSFMQRDEYGVLEGESFFGDDPLKVMDAMDDDAARVEADTDEFLKWFETETDWVNPDVLTSPTFYEDEN